MHNLHSKFEGAHTRVATCLKLSQHMEADDRTSKMCLSLVRALQVRFRGKLKGADGWMSDSVDPRLILGGGVFAGW